MKNNKWTTSENGEIFNGEEYDTREECITEERKGRMEDSEPDDSFYIGQIKELHTAQFIDCEDMIENAQCRADDAAGESAEDYLSDITPKQMEELNTLVRKWFDDNGFAPTFYGITNSELIKVNPTEKESSTNK